MNCPECKSPLKEVRYPSDSMYNREQWESQIAGDLYCDVCTSDASRTGYKYFWKADFANQPKDQHPAQNSGEKKLALINETNIRFGNAFNAMFYHIKKCSACEIYLRDGEGVFCVEGGDIIARHLFCADTETIRL